MTRKDLNLSLDNSLIQDRATTKSMRSGIADASAGPRSGKHTKTSPAASRRNIPALTTAIVAVANMVFLLLAGLWLSTLPYTIAAPNTSRDLNTTPQLKLMLAESNERLAGLEQQLKELALAVSSQQTLAAQNRISSEDRSLAATTLLDETEITVFTKEIITPTDNWYVNLGTFISEQAAVNLQSQLLSLSRQANIAQRVEQGRNVFEVRLSGFDSRVLAETAAGEVMDQTDLNGLSVWQVE
ncbi:MAG: cell division septation protein DedD [Candidatus Azotimanducaceae bacterium]|jgi:cell division septation protein DedD